MPRPQQAFRPLRVTAVIDKLAGTHFALLRYVETAESTNADAAGVLGANVSRGLTTFAEYQTHGSGRKGRSWTAPIGTGLLFTTVLPETIPASAIWAVPLWAALAVSEGLEIASGIRAQLQWPNDLLVDGHKIAGILCTTKVRGDRAWVACGIGVNVYRPADEAAFAGIVPPPAFVEDHVEHVEREDVLVAILNRFEVLLDALRTPDAIARRWETRAGVPGQRYRIRIDASEEMIEGEALRLGPQGALVIRGADGNEIAVDAGDVRVVREAVT